MANPSFSISLNHKIEINDEENTYKSNIQDIGKSGILIDVPIAGNKYYLMHKGSQIEFILSTENGAYRCTSIVLGKTRDNNLELIALSTPNIIEKIQRREFYRVPLIMDIKYYALPKDNVYSSLKDVPSGYMDRMQKAIAIDISGGGMRFTSKEKIDKNVYVIITVNLQNEILLLGKVVRVEYDSVNRNFRIGVRFEGIDKKLRESIIRFVFSKSREQSKVLK